ncbi:hypothetical protein JCM10207_007398 [Rhodosporidiobolus poonsookiae]
MCNDMPLEEVENYVTANRLAVDALPPLPTQSAPPPLRSSDRNHPMANGHSSQETMRSHEDPTRQQDYRNRSRSPSRSQRQNGNGTRSSHHDYSAPRRSTASHSKDDRPAERERRRSRSRSPRRLKPLPSEERSRPQQDKQSSPPSHWVFVGNIPASLSERYLYDKLDRRGIEVGDIFLTTVKGGFRIAYVGVYSASDIDRSIRAFDNLAIGKQKLRAIPFQDPKTGSTRPSMSNKCPERRYVGAKRHAERPPNPRHPVLFLLHLPLKVGREDIARFLDKSCSPRNIKRITLRVGGVTPTAFVDLEDAETGRRAILNLDGELLNGHAVRVNWHELDTTWLKSYFSPLQPDNLSHRPPPPDRSSEAVRTASPARSHRSTQRTGISHPSPPPKLKPASPAPPAEKPRVPSAPPAPTQETASVPPPVKNTPPEPAKPEPVPDIKQEEPPAATASTTAPLPGPDFSADLARLRSCGLSDTAIHAVQQLWTPLAAPLPGNPTRSFDAHVSFGFLSQAEARAALEANRKAPAYPREEDKAQQERYEAFLRAQAGESNEWYTVFFSQLYAFNAASAAFALKGKEAAEAGAVKDEPQPGVDDMVE